MKIYAFADEASPQLSGQIRALLENGLAGMEIRNVDGENVSALSPEKARAIRRRMDDAGLAVWSIGSPLGKADITDDFQGQTEMLKRMLEIADILGAAHLRLFSFYTPETDRDAWRDVVLERLGTFTEIARGSGIMLCHENEKGIFGDTAARCAELHRALPALHAVFDPANFVQCGEDVAAAWQLLRPYVRYLHIKDALSDGSVVPAGCGAGHIPEILADYAARGGTAVTLEPHLAEFVGLSALERAGETSRIGAVYRYPTAEAAFAAAADALRKLL